jgi:hypothetical protein
MIKQEKIELAADCLLGISDDWNLNDVEEFLDWQLGNLEDLPKGYPKEVMTRENEIDILKEVEKLFNQRK